MSNFLCQVFYLIWLMVKGSSICGLTIHFGKLLDGDGSRTTYSSSNHQKGECHPFVKIGLFHLSDPAANLNGPMVVKWT